MQIPQAGASNMGYPQSSGKSTYLVTSFMLGVGIFWDCVSASPTHLDVVLFSLLYPLLLFFVVESSSPDFQIFFRGNRFIGSCRFGVFMGEVQELLTITLKLPPRISIWTVLKVNFNSEQSQYMAEAEEDCELEMGVEVTYKIILMWVGNKKNK